MNHAQKRSNLAIFALILLVSTFGVGIVPVRAELSPDAGIESEEFQIQQDQEEQIAKEEAQKQKDIEDQKKAEEKKKADAKKKAEIAAAKKKAQAESDAKNKAELEKKLGDASVVVTSTLMPTSLYQNNYSVSAKDIPAGLTPSIVSEALSVKAGKAASVTAKTLPGATCNIDVYVVQRTPISLPGLEDKTADANGECSWTWTTKTSTPRGSWGVRIVASKDGKMDDTWTTLNIGAVH